MATQQQVDLVLGKAPTRTLRALFKDVKHAEMMASKLAELFPVLSKPAAKRVIHHAADMVADGSDITPIEIADHVVKTVRRVRKPKQIQAGLLLNEYQDDFDETVGGKISFADFLKGAKKVGNIAAKVGKTALSASPMVFDLAEQLGAKGRAFDTVRGLTSVAKDLTGSGAFMA